MIQPIPWVRRLGVLTRRARLRCLEDRFDGETRDGWRGSEGGGSRAGCDGWVCVCVCRLSGHEHGEGDAFENGATVKHDDALSAGEEDEGGGYDKDAVDEHACG